MMLRVIVALSLIHGGLAKSARGKKAAMQLSPSDEGSLGSSSSALMEYFSNLGITLYDYEAQRMSQRFNNDMQAAKDALQLSAEASKNKATRAKKLADFRAKLLFKDYKNSDGSGMSLDKLQDMFLYEYGVSMSDSKAKHVCQECSCSPQNNDELRLSQPGLSSLLQRMDSEGKGVSQFHVMFFLDGGLDLYNRVSGFPSPAGPSALMAIGDLGLEGRLRDVFGVKVTQHEAELIAQRFGHRLPGDPPTYGVEGHQILSLITALDPDGDGKVSDDDFKAFKEKWLQDDVDPVPQWVVREKF